MNKMILKSLVYISLLTVLTNCKNELSGSSQSVDTRESTQDSPPVSVEEDLSSQNKLNLKTSKFKVKLIDAPKKELQSVFVNISHIELFLKKGDVQKRLLIGQDTGVVDLLTLQNGVSLPIEEIEMPIGIEISEIRLVLYGTENFILDNMGNRCDLKTPSAQQSGVKIKLGESFVIEDGYEYLMVIDFDASKSIVQTGNGGCLLKPVIKIPLITKKVEPQDIDDDNSEFEDVADVESDIDEESDFQNDTSDTSQEEVSGVEEVVGEDQSAENSISNDLGFDPNDPSTYPDGITAEDLSTYFN